VNRGEIVRAIIEFRNDAVLIMGPGKSARIVWEAPLHPATMHSMELAYASPMAFGVALGAPNQRVISLEGDGSMFAGTQSLGTIARYAPANLTVIVIANGVWGTGDASIPVTLQPAKYADLALACGWEPHRVTFATELGPLREALRRSATAPGPWFIAAASVSDDDSSVNADGSLRPRPTPPTDLIEAADATRRYLLGNRKAQF